MTLRILLSSVADFTPNDGECRWQVDPVYRDHHFGVIDVDSIDERVLEALLLRACT